MSCAKCNRPTSKSMPLEKKQSCTFRMQDGRMFTDYRPRCTIHYQMKNETNMKNSYDTRQFLIENASKLMKVNQNIASENTACDSCFAPSDVGTMLPERYVTTCNKKTCNTIEKNPNGLGTGRNMGTIS